LRTKFFWAEEEIAIVRLTLASMTERITPTVILDVIKEDPGDNAVLDCAQTAHADYIVSATRHLLKLRHYDGIPMITVTQFLSQFRGAGIRDRS
jgi:predicted nucleic acid-binding protein